MAERKAASVLPDPAGAMIRAFSPRLITSQARLWISVGPSKRPENHSSTNLENATSPPAYRHACSSSHHTEGLSYIPKRAEESIIEDRYRLGLDAGSKTIKAVLLDEDGSLVRALYKRHGSNIKETLREVIHELKWLQGDLPVTVSVTGSAGISVSELLGIPFVQEVIATTEAVRAYHPEADAIIELGGEDAKVVYLTGGVEQRMNATCAGGTGGFIDTIAFMLGVRTSNMSTLALGARRIYPIASRCAVFAQTDVRPLLNEGASKADIAASALDAVVRQTLGGLACGRPIQGNVVFLGGPMEFIPALIQRFRDALDLDRHATIKPENAHLYPALGSLFATEQDRSQEDQRYWSLSELERVLASEETKLDTTGLARLEPLFDTEEDLSRFQQRHARTDFPKASLIDALGPLYLGIDSGSTTAKLALIDEAGHLLHADYQPIRGDMIGTIRSLLERMLIQLPRQARKGVELPYLAQAAATGYGEETLKKGFGVDLGIVETTAHVRAAEELCPDVSFVLDIGGQDMKALWLSKGSVDDAVLNEACSSGCGAFVEGTAHGLRSTPTAFASAALRAKAPVDLGTKCTVFMASRVKHVQKIGASVEDIAAGVSYSVVHNALYRIIGRQRLSTLGSRIVVQGGAFRSDAVLRAFELACGQEVIRPSRSHLMGAIGAALIARDRAKAGQRSSLISLEQLKEMEPERRSGWCAGCANVCKLSVLDFGNATPLITGNRCETGADPAFVRFGSTSAPTTLELPEPLEPAEHRPSQLPNLIAREQALIAQCSHPKSTSQRSSVRVGVMDALQVYGHLPFWTHLMASLGFSVVAPRQAIPPKIKSKAWETVSAESLCHPAKLAHAKAFDLYDQGVDALFFPQAQRASHCSVTCEYPLALKDGIRWLRDGTVPLIAPHLSSTKPSVLRKDPKDMKRLLAALAPLVKASDQPISEEELHDALEKAWADQLGFERILEKETEHALALLEEDASLKAVLLAGRPYHADEAIMHGIDEILSSLGFIVLGMTGAAPLLRAVTFDDEDLSWKQAKRLMRAAHLVASYPRLELACLHSFGCGYDAISLECVRSFLQQRGHPFTALKVDEMVETAHIRIRLRTLAESLDAERRGSAEDATPGMPLTIDAPPPKPSNPRGSSSSRHPLTEGDVARARLSPLKDACFTANVLGAQACSALKEDPDAGEVTLPETCKRCMNEAVPLIAEQTLGRRAAVRWTMPSEAEEDPRLSVPAEGKGRPRIGLLGNPLLVFEPLMNDDAIALIESLGCQVVLPEEHALYAEDVSYLDQLDRFHELGVDHVIYLQSFGCVKGHVHARGQLHRFAERFPDMPITVIDHDPESSALNRENRIRLIVEAAKRRTRV